MEKSIDIRENASIAERELDVFRYWTCGSITGADRNILDSSIFARHFVVHTSLRRFWDEARAKSLAGEAWDLAQLCNGELVTSQGQLTWEKLTAQAMVVGDIESLEATMKLNATRHYAQDASWSLLQDLGKGEVDQSNAAARCDEIAALFSDCEDEPFVDNMDSLIGEAKRMMLGESRPLLPMPLLGFEYEGWPLGKLIIVGAITSQHKTTVCLEACRMLEEAGMTSLFWTLEDNKGDMTARQLVYASEGAISFNDVTRGIKGDKKKLVALIEATRIIEGRPGRTIFMDKKGVDIDTICAVLTRAVAKRGIKLAVVDFAQRIMKPDPREQPHEHMERVSKRLADLADKLGITIILAAQFTQLATSTGSEGDRLPQIGDIKGGSGMAQNAFAVWLNYIPPQDDDKVILDMAICIRKWKGGRQRVFRATVEGRRMRIALDMASGNGLKVIEGGQSQTKFYKGGNKFAPKDTQ